MFMYMYVCTISAADARSAPPLTRGVRAPGRQKKRKEKRMKNAGGAISLPASPQLALTELEKLRADGIARTSDRTPQLQPVRSASAQSIAVRSAVAAGVARATRGRRVT